MCIYCGTHYYRKIYEHHYGAIPRDDSERSYEIHHIDGNHNNNDYKNLVALSLQEHYDVHYSQGDFYAAMKIAAKLQMTAEEISELAKASAKKQIADGKHPFKDSSLQRSLCKRQLDRGTHPFLNPRLNQDRIDAGTFHLLSGEIQSKAQRKFITEGSHLSNRLVSCLCCGFTCDYGNYRKHHSSCKGMVKIDGVLFSTIEKASTTTGVSIPTIRKALKGYTVRKIKSAEYVNLLG